MITNSFLHRLWVAWNGRRDGRMSIPATNQLEPSEYERQLIARYEQHLAAIQQKYGERLERLQAEREKFIERFRDRLAGFQREAENYNKKLRELGRHAIVKHMSRWRYLLFLGLIGLGEFALNAQAFQVFETPLVETFLIALAAGVVVPLLAHYCGILLKQRPRGYIWLLFALSGFTILGLVAINQARTAYLRSLGSQATGLEAAFLMVNLLVFSAATMLSYFAHDIDQEMDTLHSRVSERAQQVRYLDSRIHDIDGKIEALQNRQQNEVAMLQGVIKELIRIYRMANLRARGRDDAPQCFRTDPELPPLRQPQSQHRWMPPAEVKKLRDEWVSWQWQVFRSSQQGWLDSAAASGGAASGAGGEKA